MKTLLLVFTVMLHAKNPDRPILTPIDSHTYTIQNNAFKAVEVELDCGPDYEFVDIMVPARSKWTIKVEGARADSLAYCTISKFTLQP